MQSKHLTGIIVRGTALALMGSTIASCALARNSTQGSTTNFRQRANSLALNQSRGKQDNQESDKQAMERGSGTLLAMVGGKTLGQCPLKHTDVQANISGYIARVTVKQTFQNPFKDKIEAIYTFPLSENGAVDEMIMKTGDRVIHGTIKRREEAREIYDRARAQGQIASLLDQERTNIFTQSVANIEPGKEIEITINYIETLPFEKGKYSFSFPTVVGPRFIPGTPTGQSGIGRIPDTNKVPDASRITPPVAPEGQRAGHDISLTVNLNAGMKIANINSKLHEVKIEEKGTGKANISLVNQNTIPNKDFVLTYEVGENSIKSGYLTYRDAAKDASGYFTLMVVPPKRATKEQIAPKEMVFLVDCSGSQSGPPLEKAKEALRYIVNHMNDNDTFQIIAFSSGQTTFAEKPQPSNAATREKAIEFINSLQANGGTWMAPAIEKACAIPADHNRLRIVTFMTDGYVGNDYEVLGMIKKLRDKSRWFSFGTGNSVNRTLIDGIAKEGSGEAEYVLLNSSADEVGQKFYERISSPILTDVKLVADGVSVKEVFPKEVSDVWAEKPLYFKGRYLKPGAGTLTLTGFAGGKPYKQSLEVTFPEQDAKNPGIASLWARAKVDRLMSEDWFGAQSGSPNKELKEEITQTALKHHIMTQYTSFVAVDESSKTSGKTPKTVGVPVEMPEGVSREQTIGRTGLQMARQGYAAQLLGKTKESRRRGDLAALPPASALPPPPLGAMARGAYAGGGGSAGGGAPAPFNYPSPAASPMPMPTSSVDERHYTGGRTNKLEEKAAKPQEPAKKAGTLADKETKDQNRDDKLSNQKAANEALKGVLDSKSLKKISAKLKLQLNGTDKPIKITLKVKDWNKTIEEKLKALGLSFSPKDRKNHQLTLEATEAQIKLLAKETFVDFIDLREK